MIENENPDAMLASFEKNSKERPRPKKLKNKTFFSIWFTINQIFIKFLNNRTFHETHLFSRETFFFCLRSWLHGPLMQVARLLELAYKSSSGAWMSCFHTGEWFQSGPHGPGGLRSKRLPTETTMQNKRGQKSLMSFLLFSFVKFWTRPTANLDLINPVPNAANPLGFVQYAPDW